MKPLFNSLGSNYSLSEVLLATRSLVFGGHVGDKSKVTKALQQWFPAEPYYFYKGRDAIEFALRIAGVGAGDVVISQAFTCYAIEEAVLRVGARVEYADVDEASCNMTVKTITEAVKRCKKDEAVKAVLCQHVLGIPATSSEIRKYCSSQKLLFIEDLAQGFGGKDENGIAVGSTADLVILSFGRDKIIDAVSGGACLVSHTSRLKKEADVLYRNLSKKKVPWVSVLRELLYPLLTWIVRSTWGLGVGKVLLKLLQVTRVFTSPITVDTTTAMPLPSQYFPLLLSQISTVQERVSARQVLIGNYFECLQRLGYSIPFEKEVLVRGSGMRFPLRVADPAKLSSNLRHSQLYFSDRWYRKPVDCGSFSCNTSYVRGACPVAEKLATEIYNVPIHRYITSEDVERICKEVVANI